MDTGRTGKEPLSRKTLQDYSSPLAKKERMTEDVPSIDQESVIRYIRTALTMDGITLDAASIERILDLEMEYLQHRGIASDAVDAPRPER